LDPLARSACVLPTLIEIADSNDNMYFIANHPDKRAW